jgi:hypothetical protein
VTDVPNGYPGNGGAATQALYAYLGRRLRLSVVPTGVGISSVATATDESWRSQARGVVMARMESLEYLPGPLGVSVRVRLEVTVVRDGRLVMRRSAYSGATDPTRRGREADPIFQAVTQALEALSAELIGVLNDLR